MLGLPEMARFFLQSNRLQPGSRLAQHIYSGRLADLVSVLPSVERHGRKIGYDRSVLVGGARPNPCWHASLRGVHDVHAAATSVSC